jgi:hypothetical protein
MPSATTCAGDDSELLTVVRFVVRERLQSSGIELPHVWRGIDNFVSGIPQAWPLAQAYLRTGSLRCLQYVAAREPKEARQARYLMWTVNSVAALAIDRGDVQALEWLAQSYSPDMPARVEDW